MSTIDTGVTDRTGGGKVKGWLTRGPPLVRNCSPCLALGPSGGLS